MHQAVASGLRVAIAPGGTPSLTPDARRRLAALGVARIGPGVDASDATTPDRFHDTPGTFEATRRAIDAVRRGGLPLQINTSLACETVREIPDTAALVADLAPALWRLFFVVPIGRARPEQQLSPDSCEPVFDFLYESNEVTGIAVETIAAAAYRRVVVQRETRDTTGPTSSGSAPSR